MGGAAHFPGPDTLPYAGTVTGRVHSPRGSGAWGGGHVTATDPGPNRPFGVRHVVAAGGYRIVSRHGGAEMGAESGVGEPTFVDFDGTGYYLGGSIGALLRVQGAQDVEPGFAPIAVLCDLVMTGRAGVWMPPAGAADVAPRTAGSVHLGFRITAISDLLDVNSPEVEP